MTRVAVPCSALSARTAGLLWPTTPTRSGPNPAIEAATDASRLQGVAPGGRRAAAPPDAPLCAASVGSPGITPATLLSVVLIGPLPRPRSRAARASSVTRAEEVLDRHVGRHAEAVPAMPVGAVDDEVVAGHVHRERRAQVGRGPAELVQPADASGRDAVGAGSSLLLASLAP